MSDSTWYKTDNVAKVFLASFNRRDTRTMRVGCTLTEKVNPELLQEALLKTIDIRPQFQVRIRRGFFWHYIETTDVLPRVVEETGRPCPLLYGSEYNGVLHYRVSYFGRRIDLDIFHALSDGTGAFEFFNLLLGEYLKLAHPDKIGELSSGSGAASGDLTQDSFSQFYENRAFQKEIPLKAYHPISRKLPYDQLQFMEISMDSDEMRRRAKEAGVGVTSLIGAMLVLSMYKDMPSLMRKVPITVSIPVNLRKYYPSETSRNFFNSINVTCFPGIGEKTDELARRMDADMKDAMKPEKIAEQMDTYQKIERLLFIRMVPLMLKQPVVRHFSKMENRRVSFILSNMGELKPDEQLRPYIDSFSAFCAHSEMFFTLYSYNGRLKLGVTNAYSDTRMLKTFVRMLTDSEMTVTVNATEVIR